MTTQQILAEVQRELDMRKKVYPGWIKQGKIVKTTAHHRIEVMEALEKMLQPMAEAERKATTPELFDDLPNPALPKYTPPPVPPKL